MGTVNVNPITNLIVKAKGSETWDPGSLADGVQETEDVACVGAELGDFAFCSFSVDIVDLAMTCTVTAADVVTVVLQNESTGTIDLASGTLRVFVVDAQIG